MPLRCRRRALGPELPSTSSRFSPWPRWGVDISGERPKAITDEMVRSADVVVTLGREARGEPVEGTRFEQWITDEPAELGIDGIERVRLVRDDMARRAQALAYDLGAASRGGTELGL